MPSTQPLQQAGLAVPPFFPVMIFRKKFVLLKFVLSIFNFAFNFLYFLLSVVGGKRIVLGQRGEGEERREGDDGDG